jgi:hypothetical protein
MNLMSIRPTVAQPLHAHLQWRLQAVAAPLRIAGMHTNQKENKIRQNTRNNCDNGSCSPDLMAAGDQAGYFWRSSAARPATCGVLQQQQQHTQTQKCCIEESQASTNPYFMGVPLTAILEQTWAPMIHRAKTPATCYK